MSITELLINQHVNPGQVLKILIYLLPRVILFSMPAACLMCVLLSFLRLSSDSEVIALHSSGVSLYQMLPPVITFSFISYLVASIIAIYGVPWGNRSYKDVLFQIVESKADVAVKERIFTEPFDGVMFYVNSFSAKERSMKDLFVVDRRSKPTTNTIVAKKGVIHSHSGESMVTIRFVDGTVFTVDKALKTVRTIKFDSYDLNIDLKDIMSSILSREKGPKEMYMGELIQCLRTGSGETMRNNQIRLKLFEMFSIPLAIFFMGIIGAPLGAHIRIRGRTKGIVISLIIFLAYYICLMCVRYLCEMGILLPSIGIWIPDLFLLITCVYLLIRVANDHPVNPLKWSLTKNPLIKETPVISDEKQETVQPGAPEYVGSIKGKKFHRRDCRWAAKISEENRIDLRSIQKALDKGYTPCGTCKP